MRHMPSTSHVCATNTLSESSERFSSNWASCSRLRWGLRWDAEVLNESCPDGCSMLFCSCMFLLRDYKPYVSKTNKMHTLYFLYLFQLYCPLHVSNKWVHHQEVTSVHAAYSIVQAWNIAQYTVLKVWKLQNQPQDCVPYTIPTVRTPRTVHWKLIHLPSWEGRNKGSSQLTEQRGLSSTFFELPNHIVTYHPRCTVRAKLGVVSYLRDTWNRELCVLLQEVSEGLQVAQHPNAVISWYWTAHL